jgi:hypothetical protein
MNDVWTDLDSITDELEREATVGIIHNCELTSQTPVLYLLNQGSWSNTPEAV